MIKIVQHDIFCVYSDCSFSSIYNKEMFLLNLAVISRQSKQCNTFELSTICSCKVRKFKRQGFEILKSSESAVQILHYQSTVRARLGRISKHCYHEFMTGRGKYSKLTGSAKFWPFKTANLSTKLNFSKTLISNSGRTNSILPILLMRTEGHLTLYENSHEFRKRNHQISKFRHSEFYYLNFRTSNRPGSNFLKIRNLK